MVGGTTSLAQDIVQLSFRVDMVMKAAPLELQVVQGRGPKAVAEAKE
jgi:hypothetical protein